MDYTYSGDSVFVNRTLRNSSNVVTVELHLQYIKDSLGRVTGNVDQYTYDSNHPGQPGDRAILSDQLNFGFAVPVSANVTTSDLRYLSSNNQFQGGSKYTYTFDTKGRVSSVVDQQVAYWDPQTLTFLSTTYIHYLNN